MITDTIQKILTDIDEILHKAVGSRSRPDYMKAAGITDPDWHFSLTADDIIEQKIPANVIGCTGIAKLFCKLAADTDLKYSVVCTAYEPDWRKARKGEPRNIGGHQLIAVEIDGKMRMFHPGRSKLEFIDANVVVGNTVDFGFRDVHGLYLITAIMNPEDFVKINTGQKLHNIYASGNMNNPEFTIVPLSEMAVAQNMRFVRH
ncbi:MAG: hypothetical protein IKZ64_01970 [Alphaproteobacteria bacterium]|nr:hypothetical protein [Alphaproteobacteria bacterium]